MSEEIVTVALIPAAAGALKATTGLLGLSRADVINRALQMYAFIEFERAAGSRILLQRDGTTSQLEITTAAEAGPS